jgi:hypothetical protein
MRQMKYPWNAQWFARLAIRRWRIAIPLVLVAFSIWLLVGCLYLPTGENVHLTGSKKDFRSLPGDDAENKPHVAGQFTRGGIDAILGRPPYISDNRKRVMYVIHVKTGMLIAPLCFTARDRNDDCVGLVLAYDVSGHLTGWQKLDESASGNQIDQPYGITASLTLQQRAEARLLDDANSNGNPNSTRPSQPHAATSPVGWLDQLSPNR